MHVTEGNRCREWTQVIKHLSSSLWSYQQIKKNLNAALWMDKQGQFLNTELGEKKVLLFEGHCKASVTQCIWRVNAYEDAWQKKIFLCVSLYEVWSKPKHNPEKVLSYSMMVQLFSVVFSMVWWGLKPFTTEVFTLWHFRLQDAVPDFSFCLWF